MMVTPHLKTVLKDYQHSAIKSLHGPAHHLHPPFAPPPPSPLDASVAAPYAEGSSSPEAVSTSAAYVPPLPVQQLPILITSDTASSDLSFTQLEDVSISCFSVGGEKRLCLPQVLQSVLGDFTLAQINNQCDNLLIYCSRCTPEQLNVLKGQGILPSSAFSCGLITKSDAERLCSALLYARGKPTSAAAVARIKKEPASLSFVENQEVHSTIPRFVSTTVKTDEIEVINGNRGKQTARTVGRVFRVRHECFGHAVGILYEARYDAKQAKCIECVECKAWHSPQQFVKHVHGPNARGESRTVHWGFDSAKWRHYLLALNDNDAGNTEECCTRQLADDVDADHVLDLMRDRYEGVAPFVPYGDTASDNVEVKKEVNSSVSVKERNMPLKRKVLHQVSSKSSNSPPDSPPAQIQRDTSSPLYVTKKPKLSSEEYMLMGQSFLQPIDPYLSPAVFQQFSLSMPYAGLATHPLSLGHQSAKKARLQQAIAESNADLARLPQTTDDPPLPATPKKRHMQEQRRKLEEVQKSPDSTTVPIKPPTPVTPLAAADRKYSEIDLSTTDTEDTASEGTVSVYSDPSKITSDLPPLNGEVDESPSVNPEMTRLQALFRVNPHPDKRRITDMFRLLLDECKAREERIQQLEARVEVLQRSPPTCECFAEPAAPKRCKDGGSVLSAGSQNELAAENQADYKSVITLPPTNIEAIPVGASVAIDTATSTSDVDDADQHCPSENVPAAT